MKTVFVIFCDSPKHISNKLKRYVFNISGEVKV